MALQKEVWIQDIQENLFANNTFMNNIGVDDSGFVTNKTVHVPQAGANPTVKKDRSVFPATITQRGDADLTYSLHQYTTDPIQVTALDKLQVSYDKRQSVMKQHQNKLSNSIANNTLYAWAPSGSSRQIITSGATSTKNLAPSATGSRKVLTFQDIADAVALLDVDNIDPEDPRFIIMPSNIYWNDFMQITQINKYLEYGKANTPSGNVTDVLGLKIIRRSSVLVYDNTGTPVIKAVNDDGIPTSPATTDNQAILVVSASYVRKAIGVIDVFDAERRPEWYGDIISALVMQGAAIGRTNQEGVVAIVQSA
jgi:uncharacterized protein YciI